MRALNKKQRKLLDQWFEQNKNKTHISIFFDLGKCDLFSYDLYEQLEQINDFETIYQAINAYVGDKVSQAIVIK